jgi:hypothetical protein
MSGDDIVRKYPPDEAARRRRALLEGLLRDYVADVFAAAADLRSALLIAAQYWDDFADDEVHLDWIFSVLPEPRFDHSDEQSIWDPDPVNLGARHQHEVRYLTAGERGHPAWMDGWDEQNEAVPLFAAFCPEGASQYDETWEHWGRVALYRRAGDQVDVLLVGEQVRPWLAGVRSSFDHR